jgi:hypothetical protein
MPSDDADLEVVHADRRYRRVLDFDSWAEPRYHPAQWDLPDSVEFPLDELQAGERIETLLHGLEMSRVHEGNLKLPLAGRGPDRRPQPRSAVRKSG